MNLQGQAIAIAGAGRSGLAAARLAAKHGALVTVLDSGDPDKLAPTRERLPDAQCVFGEAALSWSEAISCLVISPGIDRKSALVAPWVERGVPVIGEIELASRFWRKAIVGITGTNGKTTTTELTTHLLCQNGQSAVAGGNYGKPFAEIVLEDGPWEVAVLELSSFQLESIDQFRPDISVWTNFAPDHMDRYSSISDYRDAKLEIYRNQTTSDHAIVNALDGPGIDSLRPQTISFSAFHDEAHYHYDRGAIYFGDTFVADLRETQLCGKHNAENLMAAMAVGALRNLSFDSMRQAARSYEPPRHRCERVGTTVDGITILNDSKATNVHALESSLRSLDGPIVLIAGGKEKGLDYSSLRPWLEEKVAHLITIGEIREALAKEAANLCPCTQATSLESAVEAAFQHAKANQIILFSPGTSSFDMFRGYEHRGDAFCDLVKQQLTNHETNKQTRL